MQSSAQERSTQVIFCDTSTPKTGFNIYDEENPILFKVNIDRLRFIIAFYTELLNFAYSEMYKKYYSELGEIEEDLCKLLNIESTLKSL